MSPVRGDRDEIAGGQRAIFGFVFETQTGAAFKDDDPFGTVLIVPLALRRGQTGRHDPRELEVRRFQQRGELFVLRFIPQVRENVRYR